MVLNTALFFLFGDEGDPKDKRKGYYSFKNAKNRSEDCIAFTNRLVRFIKNNKGMTKPGSRQEKIINRMKTDERWNSLKVQRVSDRILELMMSSELRTKLGILNRQRIELEFSPQRMCEQTAALLTNSKRS